MTALSFVVGLASGLSKWARNLRPARLVMGKAAKNNKTCQMFLKRLEKLQGESKDKYQCKTRHADGRVETYHLGNIAFVLSEGDASCAMDFLNALGQAGRTQKVDVLSPVDDWEKWGDAVVSIGGGHDRSTEIWKRVKAQGGAGIEKVEDYCAPLGKKLPGFKAQGIEGTFFELKNEYYDLDSRFGVILKTALGETDTWLLMGLGTESTQACGYMLKRNLSFLGALWGSSSFSALIHYDARTGIETAEFWKVLPRPVWWRRAFCWRSRRRLRKAIGKANHQAIVEYFEKVDSLPAAAKDKARPGREQNKDQRLAQRPGGPPAKTTQPTSLSGTTTVATTPWPEDDEEAADVDGG